jgi:hypothetical protein
MMIIYCKLEVGKNVDILYCTADCHNNIETTTVSVRVVIVIPAGPDRLNMFRRQTTTLLNGPRFSHSSGPRISSNAVIRGAAVATSIVAAVAATITVQQAVVGPLHNDASPRVPASAVSSKINSEEKTVVSEDDEELRLWVWGTNRFVDHLTPYMLFTEVYTL